MQKISRRVARTTMLGGLVAAALATTPGIGQAAAAPGDLTVARVSGAITIVPGTVDVNDTVEVVRSGTSFLVRNSTGTLRATPGGGCDQVNAREVNCGTGIGGLSANLGGGNDTFTARVPLTGAVSGGNGADVFNGGLATGGGTTLTYQGGGGSDTVSYAGAGVSVQVTVDGVNNDGRNSGGFIDRDKVLTDVEVIIGSRFGDTITGDDTAEIINPLGGDDRISANGGADTVELRDGGRDTFADCGSGRDIANADAGDRPTACETVNR